MKRPVPPRIALYPADKEPVVVAIMRVRSKWWHVIRINGQGEVERGSWFHGGKIMLDQCSINHDGTLLAYVATGDGVVGWSGLCRPPWLRCIAEVSTPMPFMTACAFSFEKPGEIAIRPPVDASFLSEPEKSQVSENSSRLFSGKSVQQILGKIARDQGRRIADWEKSIAIIRDELELSVVAKEKPQDRMSRQGFIRDGNAWWSWTGRDGVIRKIQNVSFGDIDTGQLNPLNCCVDADGRWWQALDGIITCDVITKKDSQTRFSIDTTSWIPPKRSKREKKS